MLQLHPDLLIRYELLRMSYSSFALAKTEDRAPSSSGLKDKEAIVSANLKFYGCNCVFAFCIMVPNILRFCFHLHRIT